MAAHRFCATVASMSLENFIEYGCLVGESPGTDISVPGTLERLTKLSGELRQAYIDKDQGRVHDIKSTIAFWMKHLKMAKSENL